MELVYGEKFLKSVKLLPPVIQQKVAEQLERLQRNPHDPRLYSKMLSGPLTGCFSFRATRDYRVVYQCQNRTTIQLLLAKHRKDIYR